MSVNDRTCVRARSHSAASVMSDSLQPRGRPTSLLCAWGFSRCEYRSGSPSPSPGDPPEPRAEPLSPASPALQKSAITLLSLKKKKKTKLLQKGTKYRVKSLSHVRLFATPRTVAHQAPLSMGVSRRESWRGLPFPSPEDLPDPGIEHGSPAL